MCHLDALCSVSPKQAGSALTLWQQDYMQLQGLAQDALAGVFVRVGGTVCGCSGSYEPMT